MSYANTTERRKGHCITNVSFLKLKKTFILLCAKYGVRSYKIADYLGYSDTHVMNIIRKNKTYDYEFNDIDNIINQKI